MKGPLYWLFVSDKDKPSGYHLSRSLIVWLFFLANAVWGLACITVTRSLASDHDSFLISAVKWVGGILAVSLPTVVVTLREADKGDSKFSFEQFIIAVIVGLFLAVFSGAALEIILSLLGVRHFLGIPIQKWS